MSKFLRIISTTLLVLVFQLLMIACEDDSQDVIADPCNPAGAAGELLTVTPFGIPFTTQQVQTFLMAYGAPMGLELKYAIDAYKITYQTRDILGELTTASGVIFIPQGIDTLDLLSTQHGTTIKRDEVGSVNPVYAIDGIIAAMNGYIVAAPDYLGLGSSGGIHPYLHAELSANAVVDMIRATKAYACQAEIMLTDRLFLAGYSEGGFVTLATHKAMESEYSDEFQPTAVAPMAGPYDLLTSTRSILNRSRYNNPFYLALTIVSYNDIYGWDRLDEIFQEPYASRIPGLFDGSYGGGDINDSLTTYIDSLFTAEFKTSFLAGEETAIEAALTENSPLNWGPIAPVRLFHGTKDSTVYYDNSLTAYESMQSNGGLSVDLVSLLGADHGSAVLPAYYLAINWFDSLRIED